MERRKHDKRTSGRGQADKSANRSVLEEEEDYGDYVTRCICGFKHDDGYMICCDECSVWQHLDCMQVDPKSIPENYLCERCEPRPVDKRRAHKIQLKKRDEISDAEESRRKKRERAPLPRTPLATVETRKVTTTTLSASAGTTPVPPSSSGGGLAKKRKKRGKLDPKTESLKKVKKEKPDEGGGVAGKRRRRVMGKGGVSSGSSIQSLLTAASMLEGGAQGEESEQDHAHSQLWSAEESPWTDKYEEAEDNLLSEVVEDHLMHHLDRLRSEAVVYTQEEYASGMGPHPQDSSDQTLPPQCSVVDVALSRRGLVVRDSVPQDELVMEYKGRIAVLKEVLTDLGISGRNVSSLWKQKPCPFVYMYDKMSNLDMCIDARSYGNQARFIRRSCVPNAELRHFFVADELHFGVYALDQLSPDEEVTLPFDFQHEKCQYPVECGCGQTAAACLLTSGSRAAQHAPVAVSSRKSSAGMATDDEHVSVRSRTVSLQKSHSHVFTDDDSNMSWTSTSSVGRRRPRTQHLQSPIAGAEPAVLSHGASSESDDAEGGDGEEPEKPRKSLSREERKTEHVMKLFEKMEASAQRKRQHLLSEGSHESDHASEASPIHTLRTSKDRRLSSSSSRKAQMLSRPSTVTMRPSSVSSMDPLSPYDPSEAFSPPMTPSLPTLQSPLSSPPPHYHVTPQLHPKYLFASFALPWKKAVLRQWEKEQQTGYRPEPRPYWESNLPVYGYRMDRDVFRIRPRGCLKHRWLKHYHGATQGAVEKDGDAEDLDQVRYPDRGQGLVGRPRPQTLPSVDESGSDKENNGNRVPALPHKKLVLLRWKEARKGKTTPPPLTLPLTPPAQEAMDEGQSGQSAAASGSCRSPLFEEFSDNDDLPENGGGSGFLLSGGAPGEGGGKQEADGRGGETLQSPDTPPLSALIGDRTYTSIDSLVSMMQSREEAPPPPTAVIETDAGGAKMEVDKEEEADDAQQLSGISDISLDSASEEKTPPPGTATEQDQRSPGKLAATVDQGAVDVSDVSSESLDGPTTPHATPPHGEDGDQRGGTKVAESGPVENKVTMAPETADMAVKSAETESGGGQAESGSGQLDSGSGQADVVNVAPPTSPPSALPTPLKTPGKRKINLSEYRNRARRPAERKGSGEKVSSTPPSTPGTPSFLTTHPSLFPSVSSSSSPFTSSLQLSTTAHAQSADTTPHFEPVSPDEDDHVPKLPSRDDITTATPLMLAGRGAPPPLGVAASGGGASSMAYSCTPGSNLYNPYSTTIQNKGVLPGGVTSGGVVPGGGLSGNAPTTGIGGGVGGGVAPGSLMHGGGVPGNYGMEGGVRWGGVEHDPRNRPAGVPPASSGGVISLPGAPPGHHAPPPSLLQPVTVPAMSYATQAPQPTVSGGSYQHQPPQPLNSAGLYMNQPPHQPPRGSAPAGLFPGHPSGFYRPQQQQPLNQPPPGNQGGGPGMFRPRRPHPSNMGGNNPYY